MESLQKQFSKEFQDNVLELLIVDNNSGDNSVSVLNAEIQKKGYKGMHVIANAENAGFGKGCNLGASKAKGKYFLLLNNDTLVKDKGILSMATYLEDHEAIAILGGQLRNMNGSLQASAGKFYTPGNVTLLLLGLQKYGILDISPKKIEEVEWVKGALLMIRSEVYKKLNGFDEKIFMYIEDMELCYRAKLAGYKIYFYPDVSVYHVDQGSGNRTFAIVNIYKNLLYFYKKHRSRKEYLFLKSLLRIKAASLIAIGRVTKNSYLTSTYEQALKVA
jgi:GT2 family glycosyltransferase